MYDLVIRGATVVDGLGHEPRRADVAVENGRIADIGEVGRTAERVVDAGGLTLMPGIIDIHTHYDAQVTWDATLSPSPSLGVTTAVMGNCGFGIVPSPPDLRDLIMRNLAVVEGMDIDSLRAGIDWEFQTFAEYLAAVRRRAPLCQPRSVCRPLRGAHRGHGRGRLGPQTADPGRTRRNEAAGRRGDEPGGGRACAPIR